MAREIRHTIAEGIYADIDMVNAHPTILEHIFKQKFPNDHHRIKYLSRYVHNREKCLKSLTSNRLVTEEIAKKTVLSVMNGGTNLYDELPKKPTWLQRFKKEITLLGKFFAEAYPREFEAHKEKRLTSTPPKTFNHEASFVNTLICDYENKVLQIILRAFGDPSDAVLCFDGCMLPLCAGKSPQLSEITKAENLVEEQLGIQIKLKAKPMTKMKFTGAVPQYVEPRTKLYTDYKTFVGKIVEPTLVQEWCNNAIVLIDNGGKHFFLTKNKRVDSMTKEKSIYYKQIREQEIMANLRVACFGVNDKFDGKFWEENKNRKPKDMTDAENQKIKKYVFESLGPSSLNCSGFLDFATRYRTLPTFNSVEFYPFLARNGAPQLYDKFNIFTGFPLETVERKPVAPFHQSLFYKHIRDELMNKDMGEFNHFLDHIADMIQHPAQVRGPSHLFYTEPGMGKGMMAVWVTRLLGSDHVITFGNTRDYFSKFNAEQSGKILKIFEEVSDKGDAFHNHDRLKGDQTRTMERVEPKGLDAYFLRHCARHWYYTNNPNALYIENNDRRHTLHKANNRYANNTEYFKPLWDEIQSETFCRGAFEFFATRKYTEKSVLNSYDTKYKGSQKISNLPNGMKFLIQLIESNFEEVTRDGDKVRAKDFSEAYKEWCGETGAKFHLNSLKSQIAKIGIEEAKSLRFNGKKSKCYSLNVDKLRTTFRKFLRLPEWDFDIISDDSDDSDDSDSD
jgi:hypothetical protein